MHGHADSGDRDDGSDGHRVLADSGFDDRDCNAPDADDEAQDHEFS